MYFIFIIINKFFISTELILLNKVTKSIKCVTKNCNNVYEFRSKTELFLALSRIKHINKTINNLIPFHELFIGNDEPRVDDFKCFLCGLIQNKHEETVFYEFSFYLIIKIDLICPINETFCNIGIANFNPDLVCIPNNNEKFRVMSAVLYYPTDPNNPRSGGQYSIVIRSNCDKKWVFLTEGCVSEQKHLTIDMKNIYILFLQKI